MAREFFVSMTGDDGNDGRTPQSAFASLAPLNAHTFGPGDAIYLECGAVFADQFLHITGSGSPEAPIIVTSYSVDDDGTVRVGGESDALASGSESEVSLPLINTNGTGVWHQDFRTPLDNPGHRYQGSVSSSILLTDVSYIEISHLEITNSRTGNEPYSYDDPEAINCTGVAVIAENAGTVTHTVLRDLYIHEVHGNVYDKHMANGGIYFLAHLPADETTGIARFDDVQVLNNRVEATSRWGIGVGYTGYWEKFSGAEIPDDVAQTFGHTNVVIRGNYVEGVGGDAITVFYAYRPLVEYNISVRAAMQINTMDYSATDFGRVAAAIWPWKTKDALFQYNEAYETLCASDGNGDGMAWDADWSDGTIYQYNYSYGNSGGAYMICGVEATNSVFRYNISFNDGLGLIDVPDYVPNGLIHNNTFIVGEGVPVIRDGHPQSGKVRVENNVFLYTGDEERAEDWIKGELDVEWQGNVFAGYANLPSDPGAVVAPVDNVVEMREGPTEARKDRLTHVATDPTVLTGCTINPAYSGKGCPDTFWQAR